MRKSVFVMLTITLSISRLAVAANLDEILSKHTESRGGSAALKAVQSLRVSGELTLDGRKSHYSIEWMRPSKVRLEYDLGGAMNVEAYDGETAWAISPFASDPSPLPLSGARAKRARARADYLEGELIDFVKKGHKVELLGREQVDGTDTYKLQIERADGQISQVYLDTQRCLVVRKEHETRIGNRMLPVVSTYSEYKAVGTIWMAHRIDVTIGRGKEDLHGIHGGTQTVEIHSIELDVALDPTRFSMP